MVTFSSAVLIELLFLVIASSIPIESSSNTLLAVSASTPLAVIPEGGVVIEDDVVVSLTTSPDGLELPLAADSNPSEDEVIAFLTSFLRVSNDCSISSVRLVLTSTSFSLVLDIESDIDLEKSVKTSSTLVYKSFILLSIVASLIKIFNLFNKIHDSRF